MHCAVGTWQTSQYNLLEADDFAAYFLRHATGGQIPGVLPRLSDAELNVTLSQNNTGNVSDSRTHVSVKEILIDLLSTDVRKVL